jgi:hypothetical protein
MPAIHQGLAHSGPDLIGHLPPQYMVCIADGRDVASHHRSRRCHQHDLPAPTGLVGLCGHKGHIRCRHSTQGRATASGGFNDWTGNQWATRYGRAYNSTTGTRVAGQRGAVENVYSGNYAYGGRGAFYNDQSGVAGGGKKVTWGNEGSGNQGTAGKATIYNPNTGNATHISGVKGQDGGIVNVNGHVLAGKDGNYYRPDGQGGWDQITKPTVPPNTAGAGERLSPGTQAAQNPGEQSQWNRVEPSAYNQDRLNSLNNQYNSRQTGAQRYQSYQTHHPSFGGRGYRGGGGIRGGWR